MLCFQALAKIDPARLAAAQNRCPYRLCDYAVGTKMIWSAYYKTVVAEVAGCLVFRNGSGRRIFFDLPLPFCDTADPDAALTAIERYCAEGELPLCFGSVPAEVLPHLTARYSRYSVISHNNYADYLYPAGQFLSYAGKRLSGQRNHVNRFYRDFPDAHFRALTPSDRPAIRRFFDRFEQGFQKTSWSAHYELKRAAQAMRAMPPFAQAGGMELNGELISVALGERCGDTLVIHIEKALPDYPGLYPATAQGFARLFAGDAAYINREDDSGDRGLRISKTQYHPIERLQKYRVSVQTEAHALRAIPDLSSDRLTYTALRREDIDAYNRLCLDDRRNALWGYDYRSDCKGTPTRDYFYRTAMLDFSRRTVLNFAIRLDGALIGEAVLYRFDGRGNAELGVRILPEYDGHGYGREAYDAIGSYAIYGLGLRRLYGRCHRDNVASEKMLAASMKCIGEEGDYLCFSRSV